MLTHVCEMQQARRSLILRAVSASLARPVTGDGTCHGRLHDLHAYGQLARLSWCIIACRVRQLQLAHTHFRGSTRTEIT